MFMFSKIDWKNYIIWFNKTVNTLNDSRNFHFPLDMHSMCLDLFGPHVGCFYLLCIYIYIYKFWEWIMLFDIDIWDWTREILFDTETSFDAFLKWKLKNTQHVVQINLSTCCACLKEVVSLWPFYIMTSINNNMMQCCPNHFGMQMSKWRSKFKYNLTSCLIGWFNKTFFCQPYCHIEMLRKECKS
jgi:hypothetical protein